MSQHRKPHNRLKQWPEFLVLNDDIDGGIPSTKVKDWQQLQNILNTSEIFKTQDEWLFRGQRRSDWGLTPSLARLSNNLTIDKKLSEKHLTQFKYSIRGRVNHSISKMDESDIWALGQHYGLMTPLLDWSHSPYVAMFFAFEGKDSSLENPKNYSRAIFALNKTKLEKLNINIFVDSLNSEHERLISQSGLFTQSPVGQNNTLESFILAGLADRDVDIDEPDVLSKFILKIHIPMEQEEERLSCFLSLRRMNLHHASLYPDLIGSSMHCNELTQELYDKMS